jgi:hypothetical protein
VLRYRRHRAGQNKWEKSSLKAQKKKHKAPALSPISVSEELRHSKTDAEQQGDGRKDAGLSYSVKHVREALRWRLKAKYGGDAKGPGVKRPAQPCYKTDAQYDVQQKQNRGPARYTHPNQGRFVKMQLKENKKTHKLGIQGSYAVRVNTTSKPQGRGGRIVSIPGC